EHRRTRAVAGRRPGDGRANRRLPAEERWLQEDRGADEHSGHRREAVSRPQAANHRDSAQGGAVMDGRRVCGWRATEGSVVLEVLLTAAFLISLAGMAVPLTARVADSARARSAASFV